MQTRTAAEQIRYKQLQGQFGPSKWDEPTIESPIATDSVDWSRISMALSLGLTAIVLSVAAVGAAGIFNSGTTTVRSAEAARVQSTPRAPANMSFAKPTLTYFIVDSLRARDELWAEQREAASLRFQSNGENFRFEVLVAGTPEEEARAFRSIDELRVRWQQVTAASIDVIDMRSGKPLQMARPAKATASQPARTYILVDSDEQHDLVVAQQAELDGGANQPVVLVAGTQRLNAEAWELIDAAKANWMNCCQTGRFEVIDMRGQ